MPVVDKIRRFAEGAASPDAVVARFPGRKPIRMTGAMTRSLRTFVGAFFAALSLATGITLAQGQPGSARVTPRPAANAPRTPAATPPAARSAPQPAQPRQDDPQLDLLLRQWEISSARIKSLHGKHIRSRSNSVFATDARASGEFYFEAPDKGRIDLVGDSPKKGAVSSKKNKDGEPFTLSADRDEKWICDGIQVLMIDEAEKQYESMPLPEEMRGANIIESPLPFLFGMKVADAKRRFDMDLISYDEKTQRAVIKAIPLQAKDAQNFIRAMIWLDTKRFVPTYVGLTDPAGTITTEYIFQEVNINNAGMIAKVQGIWGRDPFKPDLKGYKVVQPPPVQQVKGVQPIGAGARVAPAGGKITPPAFPPGSNTRPGSVVIPRPNSSNGGQRLLPK